MMTHYWKHIARRRVPFCGAKATREKDNASPVSCPVCLNKLQERDKLVLANTALIWFVIERRYKGIRGQDREDAYEAGMTGLLHAAEHFDPSRQIKFCTYAFYWIRQSVGYWKQTQNLIRVPHAVIDSFSHPERVKARVLSAGKKAFGIKSLDHEHCFNPIRQDDEPDFDFLDLAMNVLAPLEKQILDMRFRLSLKLREIGDRLHMSRERVRQIECQALDKIRAVRGLPTLGRHSFRRIQHRR